MTEFKSQICTTVEQSDRLLSLGLKPETADMHYLWAGYWHLSLEPWEHAVDDYPFDFHSEEEQEDWKLRHHPAWSLHRLWELLDKINKYEGEDELLYPRISLVEDDVIYESPKSIWVRQNFCSPKGVYENIINCFEEIIKKGYFPKEYLEE